VRRHHRRRRRAMHLLPNCRSSCGQNKEKGRKIQALGNNNVSIWSHLSSLLTYANTPALYDSPNFVSLPKRQLGLMKKKIHEYLYFAGICCISTRHQENKSLTLVVF
jgi:hypothetical protein